MQDLGILGLWYPWMWKTAEDILEHHYTAVFELIMVSHSIKKKNKKAEDLDLAKVTLKDVRNLRCFSVTDPSLSCCGGNGTKDGGGHLQKPRSARGTFLSAVSETGKDADPQSTDDTSAALQRKSVPDWAASSCNGQMHHESK